MAHDDFNSIKVQLEHQNATTAFRAQIFQFHKGTIRTSFFFIFLLSTLDFNSIKVQLELLSKNVRRTISAISIP